jgi:hypothetical protein
MNDSGVMHHMFNKEFKHINKICDDTDSLHEARYSPCGPPDKEMLRSLESKVFKPVPVGLTRE